MEESTSILLRRAKPVDAEAVARLIHMAQGSLSLPMYGGSEYRTLKLYRTLFQMPHTFFSYDITMVAEMDGRVVGLASSLDSRRPFSDLDNPLGVMVKHLHFRILRYFLMSRSVLNASPMKPINSPYIINFAVAPEYRRRGVGRQLTHYLHARFRLAGDPFCYLHVAIENTEAYEFFRHLGYSEIARRSNNETLQAVCGVSGFILMSRDLQRIPVFQCIQCGQETCGPEPESFYTGNPVIKVTCSHCGHIWQRHLH